MCDYFAYKNPTVDAIRIAIARTEATDKCFERSNKAVIDDPELALVWGYYHCTVWDDEPHMHWWTVRPDGSIYDPTAIQFPSDGKGEYEGETFYQPGERFVN